MLSTVAIIVAVLALVIVLLEQRRWRIQRRWMAERERLVEANGPPMWDWPVNGYDHPEPPELIPEERA